MLNKLRAAKKGLRDTYARLLLPKFRAAEATLQQIVPLLSNATPSAAVTTTASRLDRPPQPQVRFLPPIGKSFPLFPFVTLCSIGEEGSRVHFFLGGKFTHASEQTNDIRGRYCLVLRRVPLFHHLRSHWPHRLYQNYHPFPLFGSLRLGSRRGRTRARTQTLYLLFNFNTLVRPGVWLRPNTVKCSNDVVIVSQIDRAIGRQTIN